MKSTKYIILLVILMFGSLIYFQPEIEERSKKKQENIAKEEAQKEAQKEAEENERIKLINSSEGQWITETLNIIVNKLDSNKLDELLPYLPDDELIRHGGIAWSNPGLTRLELIAEIKIKERNHYLRKSKFLALVKDNIGTKSIALQIYEDSVIVTDKPYETFDRKGRVRKYLSNKWKLYFHKKDSQLLLTRITYHI